MNFTPEHLSTIGARTLIVTGDRDPFYPVELAVELYRAIPRSSLWVVPEAMHIPIFLAQREAFAAEAMGAAPGDRRVRRASHWAMGTALVTHCGT